MKDLELLIDEIRLTFHSLSRFAGRVNIQGLDPSERAVLEFVSIHGPTTVPDIARRRGVSRQHIQSIVNQLLDRDLAELQLNPEHRRSHKIALTDSGTVVIEAAIERERSLLNEFITHQTPKAIEATTQIIADLRSYLDQIQEST
jgi:DNA-binding MarR family transcriptional regulator